MLDTGHLSDRQFRELHRLDRKYQLALAFTNMGQAIKNRNWVFTGTILDPIADWTILWDSPFQRVFMDAVAIAQRSIISQTIIHTNT